MGAVSFSIDPGLVTSLKKAVPLDVFVETGTYQGDTIELIKDYFQEIHSVELSREYFEAARSRFHGLNHIDLVCADSAEALAAWTPRLCDKSVLYFLDAHWCLADYTAGSTSQCPLLEEIRAIGQINAQSIIIIDDARLFLAPPLAPHEISQWPKFNEILDILHTTSSIHRIMVLNDTIIFFPPSAEATLQEYGQQAGTDWLVVMNKIRHYDILQSKFDGVIIQLEEKNLINNHLKSELAQAQSALEEKEEVIIHLARAVRAFRLANFLLSPIHTSSKILVRLKQLIGPRLGQLVHNDPVPLRTEAPFVSRLPESRLPVISIVTPSYNHGRFIERTLRSILDQDYPKLEYYVQDGGSIDGTMDILKQYSDHLSGWKSAPDRGQSHAINLGFAKTSGEIMAWINSDDLLMPGTLAYVGEYFTLHPEVDVVYGHRILIDKQDREIGRWVLPMHSDAVLSWADFIPQETLFWRRSLWQKVGGLVDESFRFALDWDLLLRFRDAGARMVRLSRFMGAFRIHEAQKTSTVINEVGMEEMDRLRTRALGRKVTQTQIRHALIPYLLAHVAHDLVFRIRSRHGRFWRRHEVS